MAEAESGTLPLGGGKAKAAAPAARPPKAAPALVDAPSEIGWFEVTKGGKVQRAGGVMNIPEGKQINSASYDLTKLRRAGIELKPIDAPAWYQAAQEE